MYSHQTSLIVFRNYLLGLTFAAPKKNANGNFHSRKYKNYTNKTKTEKQMKPKRNRDQETRGF
jgi:hypothetical protein